MNEIEQIIKQNDQNIIQCDRCSNTFSNMTNLRRHFHKKKVCKPVLKDIPIEQLIEKYKVNKGCYKCENCGKEYKSAVGKCKHKKKCLLNPAIIEKKENEKLKDELQKKDNELDELKKQLVSKTSDDKVISTNGGDTNIQKADINTLNNGTINNKNLFSILVTKWGKSFLSDGNLVFILTDKVRGTKLSPLTISVRKNISEKDVVIRSITIRKIEVNK